jgi:hypothetical protein
MILCFTETRAPEANIHIKILFFIQNVGQCMNVQNCGLPRNGGFLTLEDMIQVQLKTH